MAVNSWGTVATFGVAAEMTLEKYDQMLKPNMIKVRSIVVRGLIIFMGSTLRLSVCILWRSRIDSNHCNGIVYVEDIVCTGPLPVLAGRWE